MKKALLRLLAIFSMAGIATLILGEGLSFFLTTTFIAVVASGLYRARKGTL